MARAKWDLDFHDRLTLIALTVTTAGDGGCPLPERRLSSLEESR